MRVTYLGHSGFSVETETATYLFDIIRGELPPFRAGKPVYVFASHFHADHFDAGMLFGETLAPHVTKYILSADIKKKRRKILAALPGEISDKIVFCLPGETVSTEDFTLTLLRSTDEGVAFIIGEADGTALYHAGDLNWWHWEGEDPAWNRDMAERYRQELAKLSGRHFSCAFVPLDPRLEDSYHLGLDAFLEAAEAEHIFPMHFWKKYGIIPRYLKEYGGKIPQGTMIHTIEKENESYDI